MTRLFLLMAAVGILFFSKPASADVELADWCVNNNGSVGSGTNQPSNSCNGGTSSPDPNVNTTSFDTTLEPSTNAVSTSPQSITVSFGTGLQDIGAFMNYDLDFGTYGSNGDYGTVVGTLPSTFSYDLDDEYTSAIFSNFASLGALPDVNNVSFAICSANYPPTYCDVSWALTWVANVNPALYTGGTITFTTSTTVPTTSFYLDQTSGLSCQPGGTGPSCDNVYLSATVSLTPLTVSVIPEPATWPVLAAVGSILFLRRKRLARR